MQIGRQILTSLIAEQIAHHEYLNIQKQIANANEVDEFLQKNIPTSNYICGCRVIAAASPQLHAPPKAVATRTATL